jgi:hypothetical protein
MRLFFPTKNILLTVFVLTIILPSSVYPSPTKAIFGIKESNVVLRMHPDLNTLLDVEGIWGIPMRKLRIEEMHLFPIKESGFLGSGSLNFNTGRLVFTVNWDVNFDILDNETGELLGVDSFSVSFTEKGTLNFNNNTALLGGKGPMERNISTITNLFVDNTQNSSFSIGIRGKFRKFWEEISNATYLIAIDTTPLEECRGSSTFMSFAGGIPSYEGKEIKIPVNQEGGGGEIFGTLFGDIEVVCEKLKVYLYYFSSTYTEKGDGDKAVNLSWSTPHTNNHVKFVLWKGTSSSNGYNIKKITFINTKDNLTEENYSFADTSHFSKNRTYYYLLEEIDDVGNSTFHCNHINAVTIGQDPTIDLESAINYCKKVTGSNN